MRNVEVLEVLLVEDDDLHMEILKSKLKNLGFNQIKCAGSYKEAAEYLEGYVPDLVIIDYYLDKNQTGTDLINEYLLNKSVPVIFISSFYSADVFKNIIDLAPMDFIPKNISEFDLEKSITLAIIKRKELIQNSKLKDYIFVKSTKEIKKLAVNDIEYITVDGKYLILYSNTKKFLIRSTLNDFAKKLPENFIKVHQAYIINLKYLESILVDESTVKLETAIIPFSRNFKKDLFNSYYLP